MKTTSRNTRFLLLVCGCTMIGLTLPIYLPMAHYAAPMTAAVYALVLQSMRYVRLWKWDGKPSGLFLVRAVPVICLGLLDRKSTRLNSSHANISYAVFCLKK